MMKQTNPTDAGEKNLGVSLTELSDSADGLSESVTTLNRAVDDLQVSTERCSETQRAASKSLARAADSLEAVSANGPSTEAASNSFAPADD